MIVRFWLKELETGWVIGKINNNSISFAGRLQLVILVLSSMHVYWYSMFILPFSITSDIEKLLSGFLWCQGDLKHGKAKVAWDTICTPKNSCLGIKNLAKWNVALMSKHIWNIIANKESLRIKWIHSYRLSNCNFWGVRLRSDASWGWRKILQILNDISLKVYSKVGDGRNTSACFDNWCALGTLDKVVSMRECC